MGFSSPVSSSQYSPARLASDFAGVTPVMAGNGGFCAWFPGAGTHSAVADGFPREEEPAAVSRAIPRTSTEEIRREATIAERDRIARELHDTLLQGFTSVSMQLHAALQDLPADCADVKSRFKSVLHLMDRVLEQGRHAIQGLRLSGDYHASLGEAIAEVPAELGIHSSHFRVVVNGKQRELPASLHDEAYSIAREAIANACRHSGASKIEVEVDYLTTELRICVRDNGCGIDTDELRWGRDGHWGLQGMRERADRIGGRLRLSTRIGLGTEVELCIPARIAFKDIR